MRSAPLSENLRKNLPAASLVDTEKPWSQSSFYALAILGIETPLTCI